jgi:hypothetical protein
MPAMTGYYAEVVGAMDRALCFFLATVVGLGRSLAGTVPVNVE